VIGNVIPRADTYVLTESYSPSARFISTSPRLAYPGQNPVPTASEDAVAADRGEHETTIEEEVKTTVKQTVHKTVQKDGETHNHLHPGKSDIDHLESPSIAEEEIHADKHASDPLAPHQKASSSSTTSTSTSSSAQNIDAQHPGPGIGPDHLENPSLSEAFVHADRDGADPLAGKTVNAKSHPIEQASGAASNLANAAGKVVESVKEAVGLGGKRSFSTYTRRMAESKHEDKTHPEKSGHEHLEKPSQPEEEVHADKSDKDPLAGTGQKASERKGDKAGIADSPVQQSKN